MTKTFITTSTESQFQQAIQGSPSPVAAIPYYPEWELKLKPSISPVIIKHYGDPRATNHLLKHSFGILIYTDHEQFIDDTTHNFNIFLDLAQTRVNGLGPAPRLALMLAWCLYFDHHNDPKVTFLKFTVKPFFRFKLEGFLKKHYDEEATQEFQTAYNIISHYEEMPRHLKGFLPKPDPELLLSIVKQ